MHIENEGDPNIITIKKILTVHTNIPKININMLSHLEHENGNIESGSFCNQTKVEEPKMKTL